ncbi:MAG: hypothetical protein IJ660_03335 [Alphaproteobacteria bacterium]|nr:hypothetical protein [Alphaproteobacteria bacterium]
MATPATDSSLDVAYWFFNRAERDDIYLETEKIHHLLFMAQNRYAKQHTDTLLMPCVFLCDDKGFFEPTLKKIFSLGRPFIPTVKFKNQISSFLEEIWQEYGHLSLSQFSQLITRMPCYTQCQRNGNPITNAAASFIDKTTVQATQDRSSHDLSRKKMLVSQNGPVLVSQWLPRKLTTNSNKELSNE